METTTTIAARLIALLRQLQFVQAYQQLFADDALSIDPIYPNDPPLQGLHLLIEREEAFLKRVTIHSIQISDALVVDGHFTITLSMAFTPTGQETKTINELCVYRVSGGKIVSQQFFMG